MRVFWRQREATPCHHPPAPQPGPPDPPTPSTPVGPGVLMSIHIIAEPTPNFACNSPETTSNLEFRSLELQRFQTLLKLLPIELHATFRGGKLRTPPRAPQPGPPPTSRPHKRDKIRPTRLHQRPGGTKLAQHNQNTPKSAFFRQQGEFCLGLTQNPDLLGEFFLAHEHPRFHPCQTLRPQPKPCVACTHATTPVAHWPHD